MEHLASRTSAATVHEEQFTFEGGLDSDCGKLPPPVLGPRKRKEFPNEATLFTSTVFDCVRLRQEKKRAGSWPQSRVHVCNVHRVEGSSAHSGVAGSKISVDSKRTQLSRPLSLKGCEGQMTLSERNDGSVENGVTSVASSGDVQTVSPGVRGDASTGTTTSSVEGESRLTQSCRQSPPVVNQTGTLNIKSGTRTKDAVRMRRRSKRERHVEVHTKPERRISSRDECGDGEVMSHLSDPVDTVVTAREKELNRLFGSLTWEPNRGNVRRGGKTDTACVMDPGCGGKEVGKRERVRGAIDYSCSKRQNGDADELVLSSCSREHLSSSVVTDLCVVSCSDSLLSGRRCTSYRKYRSKEIDKTPSGRGPNADEILTDDGPCVANEHLHRRSAETPRSSHPVSRPAQSGRPSEQPQQEVFLGSMGSKSEIANVDPQCSDDELDHKPTPTFVLSSGRLSKEQEKKLGIRPTTIDDDFDRYFAQLML